MSRPTTTWCVFVLCLLVTLAAMGWTSVKVLQLEQAQQRAQQQAAIEENVRLALWRMDAALGTLIAEENARPHYVYEAFHAPPQAYTRLYGSIQSGDVMLPSPLLTYESPYVRLHFQMQPDGTITSPQAPTGNMRDLAEARYTTHEKVQAVTELLMRIRPRLPLERLTAALGAPSAPQRVTTDVQPAASKTVVEYQQRAEQQVSNMLAQQAQKAAPRPTPIPVDEQPIRPIWVDDETPVLARRVIMGDTSVIQGSVLNWPAVNEWLLDKVDDLFPTARLERAARDDGQMTPRMLAALPAVLIIDGDGAAPQAAWSLLHTSLIVAWIGVIVAVVAITALMRGAMALSERRGAFVSAVTHELRTPLTTFRMYTDMLGRGMVPDEAKRQQYLDTLRREADRLSHLVENVLAYARLERGQGGAGAERISVGDMIDRIEPRLRDRTTACDMTLTVNVDDTSRSRTVRANAAGVEQILFNLVDNACKYAAVGDDQAIHLDSRVSHTGVDLIVRDHGPGVATDVKTRLFQPFSKSAKAAAESAPGVGLGLALSQRYARDMGGRLSLDPNCADGACFILFLPAA